jgi:hypothetical protein
MRRISICSAVLLAVAASLVAQLSPKYMGWGDGPVRWLMTKDEFRQLKAIGNDKAAEDFSICLQPNAIRRQPRANEFRRFRLAREVHRCQLQQRDRPRSMTDRGRAFILWALRRGQRPG